MLHPAPELSFVRYFTRTEFFRQNFTRQKRINCDKTKPILRLTKPNLFYTQSNIHISGPKSMGNLPWVIMGILPKSHLFKLIHNIFENKCVCSPKNFTPTNDFFYTYISMRSVTNDTHSSNTSNYKQ